MKTKLRSTACALVAVAFSALCADAQTLDKAMTAFKSGQWTAAIEAAEAVPADSEERPRALYVAGEAQLIVGAADAAVKSFRAVLEARPGALPARVGLGRALTATDALDEAAQVLEAAAKADAKDVAVQHALGDLHVRAKRLDQARSILGEAWKADPKNALLARSYCDALWASNEDANADKVVAQLAKALPKHPMGPFLRAVAFERAGKDNDAIDSYEKALALDPSFLDAHKNLAILCHTRNPMYTDEKRTEKSLEHYAKYFELGGKDQALQQSYTQFKGFMEQYFPKKKKEK